MRLVSLFMRHAAILALLLTQWAYSAEWSSCASDLDDLRQAADDASDAAESAERARRDYEDKKEELEHCLRFPDVYDLLRDRCRSYRWDFESARDDYQSKLRHLQSELSDVDSKVGSVSISCRYDVGSVRAPAISPKSPRSSSGTGQSIPNWCGVFRQYKGKLPRENILQVCRKNHSQDECVKCLD